MNILLYSPHSEGHYLEYINYLYEACRNSKSHSVTLLVPSKIKEINNFFQFKELNNLKIDYFEERNYTCSSTLGLVVECFKETRFLAKYIKKNNIDRVFTTLLIDLVPFAPFLIPHKTEIYGIIYKIFLREESSSASRFLNRIKFYVFSKFSVYKKIYILNDTSSSEKLNEIFKTSKFQFICDPYLPKTTDFSSNIRTDYNIPQDNTLFVMFGSLNRNKGILQVLDSIKSIKEDESCHYTFFFAGKVDNTIKEELYNLYEDIKNKIQIVLIDQYCSFDFFSSLCLSCDAILTPYLRTAQSSGIIGYASQFGKPVIAPDSGLLGELVKRYHLGIQIHTIDAPSLCKAYRMVRAGDYTLPNSDYCKDNSREKFIETLSIMFD